MPGFQMPQYYKIPFFLGRNPGVRFWDGHMWHVSFKINIAYNNIWVVIWPYKSLVESRDQIRKFFCCDKNIFGFYPNVKREASKTKLLGSKMRELISILITKYLNLEYITLSSHHKSKTEAGSVPWWSCYSWGKGIH